MPTGVAVALLGSVEIPLQTVHFTLLIVREAERRVWRIGEPRACLLCGLDRTGPIAFRLLQLRSVHKTLAAERHEAWLGIAPTAKRIGPFSRATQIEEGHALENHRAVGDPRRDRIEVAGRHRQHDLVELGDARVRFAQRDQRLPVAQRSERTQIGVVEPVADLGGASTQLPGAPRVARFQRGQTRGMSR